jgi:hypothetical protein
MDRHDQKLRDLRALWDRKRGSLSMPMRAQFVTEDFGPWFGNLALIDIPPRTIRLCGTNLIERFGRDATGCDIADLDKLVAESILSYIDSTRATKNPSTNIYNCIADGMLMKFQELILPLSDDAIDVTTILLGSYQTEKRPAWQ